MSQSKPCKGNYKVNKFFGCGTTAPTKRTYGLCPKCLYKWSKETKEGKEWFNKQFAYKLEKNQKEKEKEERKKTRQLKDQLNSGDAMRSADIYFSRYIRLKSQINGFNTCFTCGTIKTIKEIENGHYEKREHKATRYHEDNCRPQCKKCNGNTKHNGMQHVFRENLVREIGEEKVNEIERLAKTTIKANSHFYRAIATKYRVLVNELQKEMGIKVW